MNFKLKVWRQTGPSTQGKLETYDATDISPDTSFLEMLDIVNERLIEQGQEPIAFDHDCREGICGSCSMMINGHAHGHRPTTTSCQLHMREFRDGEEIVVEPWRARAFPVVKDLVVDRSAFDRVIQAGGYVSVSTGSATDANAFPIAKFEADEAFEAATCIGCGACVASCPNASAMLFVSAKIGQYIRLPQGQPERNRRAMRMVEQADAEGFGNCSNHYECEAVCPKGIPASLISELNRDYLKAAVVSHEVESIPAAKARPSS